MKNKAIILMLIFMFMGVSIFLAPVLAVEDEDGQHPTVGRKTKKQVVVEEENILEDQLGDIIPILVKKKIGKLTVDVAASFVSGYDANVNLNRYDEEGSLFMQTAFGLYGKYPISDIFTLRSGYDYTSINYLKFSEPNLSDNILSVGLDAKIADNFLWSVDYMADFVDFPRDKDSKYTLNEISTTIRQDITSWIYQKVGYEFFNKHYPNRKTRNDRGVILARDRSDRRNTVFHQLGLYLGDKTFVKTENRAYLNDSNELFIDYYDYRALKSKVTVAHLLTDKLYGTASFAYQYKAYFKRSVSDNEFDQRDHLFIYGTSIFYDVIPAVSVGTSFDFRKNYSNENSEKYEDYIVSSGVYCTF